MEPNQGTGIKPPEPSRNQPAGNGYYYKPDEGALNEIDAYAYDEFKDEGGWDSRWAECSIKATTPDGVTWRVPIIRLRLSDSWYATRSDELGGGGLVDVGGIKKGSLVKAANLLTNVILQTPVKPKDT